MHPNVEGDVVGDVVGDAIGNVVVNCIAKRDIIRLAAPMWNEHFQQKRVRYLGGDAVGNVVSNNHRRRQTCGVKRRRELQRCRKDVLGDIIGYAISNFKIAARKGEGDVVGNVIGVYVGGVDVVDVVDVDVAVGVVVGIVIGINVGVGINDVVSIYVGVVGGKDVGDRHRRERRRCLHQRHRWFLRRRLH